MNPYARAARRNDIKFRLLQSLAGSSRAILVVTMTTFAALAGAMYGSGDVAFWRGRIVSVERDGDQVLVYRVKSGKITAEREAIDGEAAKHSQR